MALQPARMSFRPQIYGTGRKDTDRFSIIVQGPPGGGKSHFMMTAPSPFVLVWDVNMGTHYKFPGIPYVLVRSWAEVEDYWLEVIQNRRLTEVVQGFQNPDGTKPFGSYRVETLCLDTLSSLGNQISLELADGHAKLGNRDKWDEYFSRFNRLLNVAVNATTPQPGHPERETYYVIAGVHEEPVFETTGGADGSRRLIGYKPTIAGRMANAGQLFTYFSTHLLVETIYEGNPRVEKHQFRTQPFGGRPVAADKVAGEGGWKRLPETLENTWPALMKAWGMPTG